MTLNAEPEEVQARFEELDVLEAEFENVELELIRKSNELNAPLWQERAELVAKIPHFWTLVFEQAPTEFDSFILPSDAQIFAECFETLEVTRFEIDDPKGSPRSVLIKFGFSDNEYFENKVLEKKFWFRKSKDWEGLVSEPVKIDWKKGKDPTEGLSDAAFDLFQARKKSAKSANGSSKSKDSELPEYKKLVSMIEESTEASPSFFAWFGFVSDYRWVSAEESEQTAKEDAERIARLKCGEKVEDDEDEDEDQTDYQETEVYPQGGEIATLIAEDLWPSAIKYFKSAHEQDGDDLSEIGVEDMDEDENESGDEIDIRGLVGKGRTSSPPNKKQRKA
ncbi:hypothetical protein BU23DRAFT_557718 [Bimuria novae-zelandiae CBS 107.79]|uniref:NAP family protein n=1 Tax=Bimuria novae-zelandiae CBS 107.79 TaxID=1447943 RepID=A0A6A5UZP7_9PLEO|nr:hypothetical protein BU23DRAFT_557718 [Bimuria novae-zelandiae CBS 107.79]